MRHTAHIFLTGAAAASLLAACSNSDCAENRSSLPLASFLESAEPHREIALTNLEIAGIGAPKDSVLSVGNASEAYLPFKIDAHSTSYVFRYHDTAPALFDTISFTYDPTPRFQSVECGVIYQYHLQDISHTSHFIDSVTCPAKVIDNSPGHNIFIYFRTQTASSTL